VARTAKKTSEERRVDAGCNASAFDRGDDASGAADAFAVLRREFEAHFDQEDRVYYVPIAEHHPELKPTFDAFAQVHAGFRRELAAIAEQLERGDLEGASPDYDWDEERRGLFRSEGEPYGYLFLDDPVSDLQTVHDLTGKPLMITEWTVRTPTPDVDVLFPPLMPSADTQAERGECE
jgi:hypothetical protein